MKLGTRTVLRLGGILLVGGLAACGSQDNMGTAEGVATADQTAQTESESPPDMRTLPDDSVYGGAAGRSAEPQSGTTAGAPARMDDGEFLASAAQVGLLEIQAAQLAVSKAASAEVKEFANMIEQAHTRQGDTLRELAQVRDIDLPKEPDPQQRTIIEELQSVSGAQFDRTYAQHMMQVQQRTLAMFEQAASGVSDPELRSYAESQLPTLRTHLDMVRSLRVAEAAPRDADRG